MTFQPLQKSDRVFVAGHRGLVGSALIRQLQRRGYPDVLVQSREVLDLRDPAATDLFFAAARPSVVILAAARVGGIQANAQMRTEFLLDNLAIQNSTIMAAHRAGCRMVVFLGSSCVYPQLCPQPIKEEYLLGGQLEWTNRPYALAKIAGLELVSALNHQWGRRYFAVMPTNLYGPGDLFDPQNSHVVPALIQRFHAAKVEGLKQSVIWGSGTPLRELLFADDCADGILHLAENLDEAFFSKRTSDRQQFFHVNLGSGQEISIADLASTIAEVVGFEGRLVFDASKPDGTPRKRLDLGFMDGVGWRPRTTLREGLAETYRWYLQSLSGSAEATDYRGRASPG